MRGVKLDAVQTCLSSAARAVRKMLNGLFNLLQCHSLAEESMERVHVSCGREPFIHQILSSAHISLTAGVTELHDEFAVILMDALAHRSPERDLIVVVDHRVVRQYAAADMNGNKRRNDRSDSSASEFCLPINAC